MSVENEVGMLKSSNNYGDYRILKYHNHSRVKVQFIDTGYTYYVEACQIKRGTLKDPYVPNTRGIGFLGEGEYKTKIDKVITKSYSTWCGMFERCYCSKYHSKSPTYAGCTVAPEWHNYQVFAKWFDDNYVEGFELDKDIRVVGNKVYSPSTCKFVSPYVNSMEAQKKKMRHQAFWSPTKALVYIFNVNTFCKVRDLSRTSIQALIHNKIDSYKGWTLYKEENNIEY